MPVDPPPLRFLADMGVAAEVVRWLREQGYDAVHLRDQGLQRLKDDRVFDKAEAEGRALLTFDLDFGEITALSRGRHIGVVLFRLHDTTTLHVIDRLNAVLASSSKAIVDGAFVVVQESRHRVRFLPIGGR